MKEFTPQSIRLIPPLGYPFKGANGHTRFSRHTPVSENQAVQFDIPAHRIVGPAGELPVLPDDRVVSRLAMLIEGQCEGTRRRQGRREAQISASRDIFSCSNSTVNKEA